MESLGHKVFSDSFIDIETKKEKCGDFVQCNFLLKDYVVQWMNSCEDVIRVIDITETIFLRRSLITVFFEYLKDPPFPDDFDDISFSSIEQGKSEQTELENFVKKNDPRLLFRIRRYFLDCDLEDNAGEMIIKVKYGNMKHKEMVKTPKGNEWVKIMWRMDLALLQDTELVIEVYFESIFRGNRTKRKIIGKRTIHDLENKTDSYIEKKEDFENAEDLWEYKIGKNLLMELEFGIYSSEYISEVFRTSPGKIGHLTIHNEISFKKKKKKRKNHKHSFLIGEFGKLQEIVQKKMIQLNKLGICKVMKVTNCVCSGGKKRKSVDEGGKGAAYVIATIWFERVVLAPDAFEQQKKREEDTMEKEVRNQNSVSISNADDEAEDDLYSFFLKHEEKEKSTMKGK